MELSYWEYKSWLSNVDFVVLGSGIVGLNTALGLRSKYPAAKIVVLEKGILPQGASTKNAGFACFGSISEILADLKTHSEEAVVKLVAKRVKGINLMRATLGDTAIDYKSNGGHEVFLDTENELYNHCLDNLAATNSLLKTVFNKDCFVKSPNSFQFLKTKKQYISQVFEGQIDTGKMMLALLKKVHLANIILLNNMEVTQFKDLDNAVEISTNAFSFKTKKLLIATNGFAQKITDKAVIPARAQVLITKPIKNLAIKGCFHLNEGFYYFRNIDNRILLGGGRNLDFKTEETTIFGTTDLIQQKLEEILKTIILPTIPFKIDQRWSGIMGVGTQKEPIVQNISTNVACGVRLGGMGIAIGAFVGKELSEII